ncbi:MAG: alanine racemase [Syntrophobacterales bacterium]|nr:alanine racemase [Syntrophobacterales bacterium]
MSYQEVHKYRSWVEVDLDHFARNWKEIKRLVRPGVRILQVVKADAYGHGAIEIAEAALKNGAVYLGVANADEGVQLRVSGLMAPIVILSPSPEGEIGEIIKYNLIPSVSDLHFARTLQERCAQAHIRLPVHIEVDTGMGRGGTLYYEAYQTIKDILAFPDLIVEGIFTHLAASETLLDYNEAQADLFNRLLAKLADEGIRIPLRHMSNSGAILNYPQFNLDMVRPGLMTYGIYPSPETREKADLLPVMSFKTRIVLLKDFPKGYSIGYNRTYITDRPTRIATIPIGYGDGYGVILSNQGEVLIRGKRVPVVGRVSMDMCTVDVSGIPDCQVGDEVVLMGRQGQEAISANEIAGRVGSISYEILCALGKRAPRLFLHKGKADSVLPRLRRIYIPAEERSIDRIDSIIRQCFQARARSEELGNAIYYEMFETLFGKEDRQLELREDFRYDITVAEGGGEEKAPRERDDAGLNVTTRVAYRKTLKNDTFFIGCAFDEEQLASFFEDPRCEYRWLMSKGEHLVMERDFRVAQVTVEGRDVPIIRTEMTSRGYEVWCRAEGLGEKVNAQVDMAIEIFTKKSRANNVFSVYIVYPTRGLDINFNYEQCRFRHVREVSFFAGKQPYPEVRREKGKFIRLRVPDHTWIFPNSGVTFIWDS